MKLSFPLKGIGTTPGIYCTQLFGENPQNYNGHGHTGLDWGCLVGTPIYASHSGRASYSNDPLGYGQHVRINGADGLMTLYGHMSKFEGTDREVKEGDLIGYSGSTGYSTGPHLHFEVRINGVPVDPRPLMKILIRFVGWRDAEKGIYLPFDSMDRMDEVFASIPALKDYQFEEHEFNLGRRPFPDPFGKV